MAKLIEGIPSNFTEYPNSFLRQEAFPLEAYSIFSSKSAAEEYATTNPLAYVGQPIAVKESGVMHYYVINTDSSLIRIGELTEIENIYKNTNGSETGKLPEKISATEKKIPQITGTNTIKVDSTPNNGQAKASFSLQTNNDGGNVKFTQDTKGLSANVSFADYYKKDEINQGFKKIQSVVDSPIANGSTTAFIDSVSQDTQGKITVTKKNVDLSSKTVSITATDNQHGLKCYTISQGGTSIGCIDIPVDMVVTSGKVENKATSGVWGEAGTYLVLTIANQTAPVYINTKDLVDVYTAKPSQQEIQVYISTDNVISAEVVELNGSKIKYETVGTDQITDGSINLDKIAENAIRTKHINNGEVTDAKLAVDAVTTDKIKNSAVTYEKMADNAIGEAELRVDAVTETRIKDGAVTTGKIASHAVGTGQLGNSSVTTSKIADGNVTGGGENGKIAAKTITDYNIADDAVITRTIKKGTITTEKLSSSVPLRTYGINRKEIANHLFNSNNAFVLSENDGLLNHWSLYRFDFLKGINLQHCSLVYEAYFHNEWFGLTEYFLNELQYEIVEGGILATHSIPGRYNLTGRIYIVTEYKAFNKAKGPSLESITVLVSQPTQDVYGSNYTSTYGQSLYKIKIYDYDPLENEYLDLNTNYEFQLLKAQMGQSIPHDAQEGAFLRWRDGGPIRELLDKAEEGSY